MKSRVGRELLVAAAAALVALVPASNALRAMEAAPGSRPQVVQPTAKKVVKRPTAGLADLLPKIQQRREIGDPPAPDLFTHQSWYIPPPPPPKPKPLPPPPPSAPPLPFSYMGSYQDGGGPLVIFLTKGDQLYTVSPGDVIEGIYRVDGISSGQLSLTYLPLNIRQSVAVGDAS